MIPSAPPCNGMHPRPRTHAPTHPHTHAPTPLHPRLRSLPYPNPVPHHTTVGWDNSLIGFGGYIILYYIYILIRNPPKPYSNCYGPKPYTDSPTMMMTGKSPTRPKPQTATHHGCRRVVHQQCKMIEQTTSSRPAIHNTFLVDCSSTVFRLCPCLIVGIENIDVHVHFN